MNLYILVEGERTEMLVYPCWLSLLRPDYKRISSKEEFESNTYLIMSGMGQPQIFNRFIPNAVEDICSHNDSQPHKIDTLVVCMDTDRYGSIEAVEALVHEAVRLGENRCGQALNAQLKLIFQNKCIETWFLGNSSVYLENPSKGFKPYHDFYNVSKADPETMDKPACEYRSVGNYHFHYLKSMLEANHMPYSKNNSQCVCSPDYLSQLRQRVNSTQHLRSLKNFFDLVSVL